MKICPSFVHNLGMFLKAEKEAEMIIHGLLVSPLYSLYFLMSDSSFDVSSTITVSIPENNPS